MGFLTGKTALITGAGRAVLQDGSCGSIGYGIATAYAKEGANLVITGRNVKKLEDLKEGMVLPGIVTNITAFGCFVDVGIKENGLVHISEMADRFISDPTQVVSMHQHVKVKVQSVDLVRKRVQLSMKGL